MRNEILGNFRWDTKDEIYHACRRACVDESTDEFGRRCRSFFRCLDDDRATGCERRRELAYNLIDRKVPRRERRNRADRLFDRKLIDTGTTCRNNSAVSAFAFLGKPFDHVGCGQRFALGFHQCFALLCHHELCDHVRTLSHQRRRFLHNLRALKGRDRAPDLKALVSCG